MTETETDEQRAFEDVWSHICDLGAKDGVTPVLNGSLVQP